MKITALVAIATAAAASSQADQANQAPSVVAVCMATGSVTFIASQAQNIAAQMFAGIGVTIRWHRSGSSCPAEAIQISLSEHTPPHRLPGSMAFAMPFEGIHIQIFYDRLARSAEPRVLPTKLAHVMVHEITHILQGESRHSETGVMKAAWDDADYDAMAWKPLPFTETDILLIHQGLESRMARGQREDKQGLRTISPGQAHSQQQFLIARIGAQRFHPRVHLNTHDAGGPLVVGLIQPFEGLIFISQGHIDNRELPGGNNPPFGHLLQFRKQLKICLFFAKDRISMRQIGDAVWKKRPVLGQFHLLLQFRDGVRGISLLLVSQAHDLMAAKRIQLEHFTALLYSLFRPPRGYQLCAQLIFRNNQVRIELQGSPCRRDRLFQSAGRVENIAVTKMSYRQTGI